MNSTEIDTLQAISNDCLFILTKAEILLKQWLQNFANSPDFLGKIGEVFGGVDVISLQRQWQIGEVEFPEIKVVSPEEINGANAAFAASLNTIYFSGIFLQNYAENLDKVVSVFLEEYGHYLDSQLNIIDTIGDEGKKFSTIVRGVKLSTEELARIDQENDKTWVTLDGQTVEIEQNTVTGTEGNDVLTGTDVDDTIDGLGGNDTLRGLAGDDSLIGGLGNDALYGEAGNDTLDGGEGDDYLVPGTGVNNVIGGLGSGDRADFDYSATTTDLTVNYSDVNNGTISDGSTLKEVEQVVFTGGSGDDTLDLSATTASNTISGGAGNDLIIGGSADFDALYGNAGDDTIRGGAGSETPYYGSEGLYGGDGNDSLLGEAGAPLKFVFFPT